MSKVFFDLDFDTIENGLISLNKNANQHDLSDSITYKQKQEVLTLEKELIYSSYEQLKNWFDTVMQSEQHEEEVREWI